MTMRYRAAKSLLAPIAMAFTLLSSTSPSHGEVPVLMQLSRGTEWAAQDKTLLGQYCPAAFLAEADLLLEGLNFREELSSEEVQERVKRDQDYALTWMRWRLDPTIHNTTSMIVAWESLQQYLAVREYKEDGRKVGASSIDEYFALSLALDYCSRYIDQ